MLDLVQSIGHFGAYNSNGIIYVVRRELMASIGAALRGGGIPDELNEFQVLIKMLSEVKLEQAERRRYLRRSLEPYITAQDPQPYGPQEEPNLEAEQNDPMTPL